MTCNFRVGQKVVCVDAVTKHGGPNCTWCGDPPVKGAIYTIRNMLPSRNIIHNGVPIVYLWFDEIRRDSLAALRAILLDPSKPVSGPEGPVRKRVRERA